MPVRRRMHRQELQLIPYPRANGLMTTTARIRKALRSVLSVTLVCLWAAGALLSQAPSSDSRRADAQQQAHLLVERISNPASPARQRVDDYQDLSKLDVKTRDLAYASLVGSADESIASMAAAALIRDNFAGVSGLVVPRISRWSENNQLVVLEAIRFMQVNPAYFDIAREVVSHMAPNATTAKPPLSRATPLDVAAVVLAGSDSADDRALLSSALVSQPGSRGVWLAMTGQGKLGPREAILADSTYKNSNLDPQLRIAAAAALASADPSAAAFATSGIRSFLSRFADREMGEMLNLALTDPKEKQHLYDFREQLSVLSTLRFLDDSKAESIAFDFLSVRNEEIRMTLGLVAVVRWPQRFLTLGQGVFTRDEYESLLAFLSVVHPDETPAVLARLSKSRLDELVSRLTRVGVAGVFGSAAMLAAG